ncbi:hypothetical protein SY83_16580 [Paenibacillus swuensis]|uniref:SRPBCC family protein n=1 Tax=Paenibacillus swuensis TaxID=1178515 RepID=A0A172TLI1_9BACL|nr:SRPBCC family protein [Paenibacillus swuensis]ANE47633.1 hypothetical protein SY83_16580 [Paenibacillus swuensis]
MKTWTESIEIHAPIERVWALFDGSLENMQKMMPQVVENKPLKVTENQIGSVYRQKYQEGKRVEEYDVETLEYTDTPEYKVLKVGFALAKMFDITAKYEMTRVSPDVTLFKYTATNKALKWFVHVLLLMVSSKVVKRFVLRVKEIAENKE